MPFRATVSTVRCQCEKKRRACLEGLTAGPSERAKLRVGRRVPARTPQWERGSARSREGRQTGGAPNPSCQMWTWPQAGGSCARLRPRTEDRGQGRAGDTQCHCVPPVSSRCGPCLGRASATWAGGRAGPGSARIYVVADDDGPGKRWSWARCGESFWSQCVLILCVAEDQRFVARAWRSCAGMLAGTEMAGMSAQRAFRWAYFGIAFLCAFSSEGETRVPEPLSTPLCDMKYAMAERGETMRRAT